MTDFQERRRFLQIAGTGIGASVAGCSDLNPLGDDQPSELTALAEPDPEEMQELEMEAMEDEITEEEFMQRQMELFEDASEDLENRVESEDDEDLRIEDTEEGAGVYLVDGSPNVLIDALRSGDISALGGNALYEQIVSQSQPEGDMEEDLDEEDIEEIEEELEGEDDDSDEAEDDEETEDEGGDEDGGGTDDSDDDEETDDSDNDEESDDADDESSE